MSNQEPERVWIKPGDDLWLPSPDFANDGSVEYVSLSYHEAEITRVWDAAIAIAKQHRYWGGFLNDQVVAALEAAREAK